MIYETLIYEPLPQPYDTHDLHISDILIHLYTDCSQVYKGP